MPPRPIPPQPQDINNQQGCRRPEEPTNPQDTRPLCSEEIQQDCRPFLERPKPGDRRPVCRVNRQPAQRPKPVTDIDKGQNRIHVPPRQPSYPQNGRYPASQTTRRQSWQSTTKAPPQQYEQTNSPNQQIVGKQPQPVGDLTPPQHPGSQKIPQPGSHQPHLVSHSATNPTQPQTGSNPSRPQTGSYPSQPHRVPHTSQPQSGSYPSQPQTGSHPSQPQTGSFPGHPQSGVYPSQPPPGSYPNQPQGRPRPSHQLPSRSFQHQPQTRNRPPPPQPPTEIQSPQPPNSYPTSSPNLGSPPSQPQSNNYPSRPQPSQSNIPSPRYPQIPSQPQIRPQSGNYPSPPRQETYPPPPQTGFTPSIAPPVHQTGSHPPSSGTCVRCPNQQNSPQPGFSDARPNQQLTPQRQTVTGQGQQVSFTPAPGRGTIGPRVPISFTETSTTPSDDARRTLYEIVEDPALLIRGRPVKLTRIFSLFHKAGIEDILTGPGPTTVFLPSDDAFSTLPKGVVEQLEENPDLLRQVLLYHVTASEILPSAEGGSFTVPSLEGNQLVITMLNGGRLILISGAKAVAVTRANNGIFYVINQLLYPLPHADIVGAIQSRPDLSTLAWLLPLSGLTELLQGQTPHTILAPTDNAFAQLPPAVFDELTKNPTALQGILLNHIIDGAHYGREFLTGATFPSARGGKLKFQVVSYGYQVNDVNIKTPEIVTGTGVIHLVDQVLLEEPDLNFINSIENSVNGPNSSSGNPTQQPPVGNLQPPPRQQLPFGQAPPTGNLSPVGNISPSGQPQVTGLQPTFGQQPPAAQRPTHGQRPPAIQPQAPAPAPFRGQRPSSNQPQAPAPAPFRGQQPPTTQPHVPSQSPFRGQQPPPGPRQPSPGGHRPPTGQQSFNTERQPVFQPQSPSQSFPAGSQSQGTGPSQNGASNNDVADLARSMGLNRFANWISNTGLLEKIHDGGVYTVFAPTDEAVSSLPQEMIYSIDSNPEQVKNLLQYHILPQKLNLNSLSNEETASTLLQSKKIRFNIYDNVHPDCKQLVTASGTPIGEPIVTMGSVQVIPVTQVLYQPAGNLLNIVEASPILRKLAEAVRTARLTWVLSGNGPVTIFAPSDTAFNSLTDEQRKTMIEDKQAFGELLKRHMVRGTYFSSGVQEDLEKRSENGQKLAMSLNEGILTVNSVPVTYSDITATNGVLHVIDKFL